MRGEQKLSIQQVAGHRNGVSGMPFHIIKFRDVSPDEPKRNMVGILFNYDEIEEARKKKDWTNPYCAVFDLDLLSEGNITFGENSFRGDHYADALFDAVTQFNKKERRRLSKWIKEQQT